jgi:molybdate transport system substrate-binding protein
VKKTALLSAIILSTLTLLVTFAGCSTGQKVELNVSAGAGLTDVLTELNEKYMAENHGVKINANFAASGTLTEQIRNGSPTDVFISASRTLMDTLQENNLLVDSSRRNFVCNKLVLIVPTDSELGLSSFEELTDDQVKNIAIGDPKFVPAGMYAQKAFDILGIIEQVQQKLVLCADVRQVLSYVESGNVDAGIVYLTDAETSNIVKVVATGPSEVNKTIVFPVAIIRTSKNVDAAKSYIDFLFSDTAKTIIEKQGWTAVTE